MMWSSFLIALAAFLPKPVIAAPPQWALESTPSSTKAQCLTRCDTTAAVSPVTTTWNTISAPCTVTLTKILVITVDRTVTTTTYVRKITQATTQSTAIETITTTETTKSKIVVIITTTVLDKTTSTVLVPTSSGFVPVVDSLPGARDLQDGNARHELKRDGSAADLVGASEYTHAQEIVCATATPGSCVTSTVFSTTSTAGATITETETFTRTVTSYPKGTTTLTVTFTTLITRGTATLTKIVTKTQDVTTTTSLYQACATDNAVSVYGGLPIHDLAGLNKLPLVFSLEADNAYDCCVAALTGKFPGVGAAYVWSSGDVGSCHAFVDESNVCEAGQVGQYVAILGRGDIQAVVGNLNCGKIVVAE